MHSSPLEESPTELPYHVNKAIRMRATLAEKTVVWRKAQLQHLHKIASNFPPETGPRYHLMDALLKKVGSQEQTLAKDSENGFAAVGLIPRSGRWKDSQAGHSDMGDLQANLQLLLKQHAKERSQGSFRLPSTRTAEMLGILRQETEKGFWKEYSLSQAEASLREFCCWRYFPVDERDKVRGCLDPEDVNTHTLACRKNVGCQGWTQ